MSEHQARRVDLAQVDTLRHAGLISEAQYLGAVYRCRDTIYWTRWALNALLALGAGHLLAGIIFFFAYNWDDLSAFSKIAILQSGIFTSAVAAWVVRLDRPGGQALLIGASVLVGALLAVIGQVYQTGADAYELFSTWAVLILPWVLASRSGAHWLVWLVVVYLAFGLYGAQVLVPLGALSIVELITVLGLGVAVALGAREAAQRAGAQWLAAHWTRLVVAFAGLCWLFLPATGYVLDVHAEPVGALAFVVMVVGMAFVYGVLLTDFAAVTMTAGFVALFLMALGWRVLEETIGFDWESAGRILSSLGLLVVWCVAVTGSTLKFFAALRQRIGTQQH